MSLLAAPGSQPLETRGTWSLCSQASKPAVTLDSLMRASSRSHILSTLQPTAEAQLVWGGVRVEARW